MTKLPALSMNEALGHQHYPAAISAPIPKSASRRVVPSPAMASSTPRGVTRALQCPTSSDDSPVKPAAISIGRARAMWYPTPSRRPPAIPAAMPKSRSRAIEESLSIEVPPALVPSSPSALARAIVRSKAKAKAPAHSLGVTHSVPGGLT